MYFRYENEKTRAISFPLGGIGSGSIGLAGNGRLANWEIYNHPGKGLTNGFSHIAVKAEAGGEVLDARVLHGDELPPYTGTYSPTHFASFGFGPNRDLMMGVPHFREHVFEAQFPFAKISFGGERFPGEAALHAFSPFIPLNDLDSSLPAAMFEISFRNTRQMPIRYTACFTLNNPLPKGRTKNEFEQYDSVKMIHMTSPHLPEDDPLYGDIVIATDAEDVSYQEYWYRGAWFDNLGVFWRDFTSHGALINRYYDFASGGDTEHPYFNADLGSIAASVELAPGEERRVKFVLSWNFPYYTNTWSPQENECGEGCGCKCGETESNRWKNFYATVFGSAVDSARYVFSNWTRLSEESRLFSDAIHGGTLPREAIDAITGNLAVLKSPTCLRLTDGSFYGFEGCHCAEGCCEGSCSHVWNYAYALPYLFPKLERSMRELEYKYSTGSIGDVSFRLQLPLGRARSTFRPCVDGQFGGVIKTYREWKICGDDKWLRDLWPYVKASIEYAWHPENPDKWDPHKSGVLTGRQHHTLDMELFGPSAWLTGFYLAALKAGAEMAKAMGDPCAAEEYLTIFTKGKEKLNDALFNGEYYMQNIDVTDKSLLKPFESDPAIYNTYWSDEHAELKYQIGDGCGVDQVLAQWHANLVGLGEIFDQEKTRMALHSIYNNNFKRDMRDFFNPCRIFAAQDESGVIICDWPDMQKKPRVPLTYAEECMNGFEYQAAIHMIQEGLIEEGLEIVRAVRFRYDGERRDPWNEFECGSNYARSMATYALLLTFSGMQVDMTRKSLAFAPLTETFSGFWSLDTAWGMYSQDKQSAKIEVLYGSLALNELRVPFAGERVSVDDRKVKATAVGGVIRFEEILEIKAGQTLVIG